MHALAPTLTLFKLCGSRYLRLTLSRSVTHSFRVEAGVGAARVVEPPMWLGGWDDHVTRVVVRMVLQAVQSAVHAVVSVSTSKQHIWCKPQCMFDLIATCRSYKVQQMSPILVLLSALCPHPGHSTQPCCHSRHAFPRFPIVSTAVYCIHLLASPLSHNNSTSHSNTPLYSTFSEVPTPHHNVVPVS